VQVLLWAVQAVLAIVFVAHGLMFLFPPPEIAVLMNESLPRWFQLALGVAEVLGGIGILLPALTGVFPFLVSWAAIGIAITMICATVWHIVRAEYSSAAVTFVLLAMAALVVYKRRPSGAPRPSLSGSASP
jgi:uncharacterized membrane protein YphA (DoxX/SURF4 family)